MSSVRAIAKQAGVSITTVSRALNNDPAVHPKTRDLVLGIANRCGYVPNVGRRVTTNIGFAYTLQRTLAHPFDASVLAGIARGTEESRFDVVLLNLARDKAPDETYTQFFWRKGVRGVIVRTLEATRHVCESIAEEGFPHVVVAERFEPGHVNCIDCDSRPDSIRAVEYLITLGHTRIAFAMHNIPDRDHRDRFEAYKQALAKHGLKLNPSFVFQHPCTIAGGATVMDVAISMHERPTAIYLADPMMAVGAVKKAHELGVRIPADMSIIGFDDTDVRHSVYPTLTAVCQNAASLGYEAMRRLTRLLTGGANSGFQQTIPTFFEVNGSTGPPAAAALGAAGWGETTAGTGTHAAAVMEAAATPGDQAGE